ncbi:MAG: hypothetical protein HeimC3_50030 [Candidatus Heimdallarchaeota archaeon LC_3]|nr:MAG: hypothetical protein HeimC3_50030 [Candidatus Heimdallarchaeota archaeon LC_3]
MTENYNKFYLSETDYNLLSEYKNLSNNEKKILEDFRYKPKGYIKIHKDDKERRIKIVNSFITPVLVFSLTYLRGMLS